MSVKINLDKARDYLDPGKWDDRLAEAADICRDLLGREDKEQVLGWRSAKTSAVQLEAIRKKARKVRENADALVIVGVGGSNQAARAMIEALDGERKGPEVIYLGNTLSPHSISAMLKRMAGKNVCIDVIAKNFETLEPGSHFRVLRRWMARRYTKEEMAERIIVTGTAGSRLEEIAGENGYLFLQFPLSAGGRYSAFTPVCLFPAAAAGLDLDAFLSGMERAAKDCADHPGDNPAVRYAAARNTLYDQGYNMEMLASFEPRLAFFTKWWAQLFGESEGKDKEGIFPATAIYSEDLHSIGQYMQDGRRSLIETFLSVENPGASVRIEPDPQFDDGFDYLDGKEFDELNKAAEQATLEAHSRGGVPCIRFQVETLDEETFGELFYYFMVSCAVSGTLMGVNPFDQEGVEEYKRSMFAALKKPPKKV